MRANKSQLQNLMHWESAPQGVCLRKDLGGDPQSSMITKVSCPLCLHAAGKRYRHHHYAIFCDDKFQSSHVTRGGAQDALRKIFTNGDDSWHLRKWDVTHKKWFRL